MPDQPAAERPTTQQQVTAQVTEPPSGAALPSDEPPLDELPPDGPPAGAGPAPRGRRRRARRVVLVVVLVLVALLVALGWVAYRAIGAVGALQDAQRELEGVTHESGVARLAALQDRLPAVQDATARARERSDDPVWRAAEHVPWLGAQLGAVRALAVSLDDVASDALPAAGDAATLLTGDGLRAADGRLDLAALRSVGPALADAAQVADGAAARVAGVDPAPLVGPLRDAVVTVDDVLDDTASTLGSAATTAQLLPGMLGADGPRTYLVLALNSAELRSAGGIVGSVLVVRVDDGRLTLLEQKAARDVADPPDPVLPLTPEELDVQGVNVGRYIQDAVTTPEFPRAAALARELWVRDGGQDVDGVLALDPVAARLVLRATGPLDLPDGTRVRQGSFLQRTLRDVYLQSDDDAEADLYFSRVAAALLGAVAGGAGETDALVRAVAKSSDERRVRVWSADPDEQAVLEGTTLGGAFLTGPDEDSVGVFLDDATAGKLDYDLTSDVTVTDLSCDGPQPTATVRLDLSYSPPSDLLTWRDSVLGTREQTVPRGSVATRVTFYGPRGSPLPALRVGEGYGGRASAQAGRPVQQMSVLLAPGEATTITATVPVRGGGVDVWTTPTVASPGHVTATCPAP